MKISKKISKKIIKAYATVAVIANTLALNISVSAADTGTGAPSGVDTANYDSLLDIIFWAVGILIAACACIPGFKAMAEGQANEDKRGFNAGLTAVIAGVVCGAACVAIRTFLF
ncbi:MAG: hypothetical protein EGR46_00130 [Ruminococcus sp.]|jgi:hypothetical protein|uniref:hypothetical protein n=1 Tax=Ruminococcus sp. TaxID=41978 RepID=UPI0025DED073|nr:hypothetical protein [Ruminococcus sp.]MBD9047347.1 hypothetical protein [Ruminococcus sp.]